MIRSASLTAVQTTMKIEPLTSKRQAAVSRPGDWASLNPQPLPPKDVLANVRASFGVLNTKAPAASELNLFLAVNAGSGLATHVASSHHLHRGADALQPKLSYHSSDSILAAIKAAKQAEQLTKAEQMMEDAYWKLSKPDAGPQERSRAIQEEIEAHQIRESVKPGLSRQQQDAISEIESTQEQALKDVSVAAEEEFLTTCCNPHSDPWIQNYMNDGAKSAAEFKLGAQENKALINSL